MSYSVHYFFYLFVAYVAGVQRERWMQGADREGLGEKKERAPAIKPPYVFTSALTGQRKIPIG